VILACGVPIILIFRKYAFPIIQWTLEWIIYCGLFHVVVYLMVCLVRWFQYNTQMEMRVEERVFKDWATPFLEFWSYEAYKPNWLFWMEVTAAILMLVAMIRYRPMRTQKIKPRKPVLTKGVGPSQKLAEKYGKRR